MHYEQNRNIRELTKTVQALDDDRWGDMENIKQGMKWI